MKRLFLLFIICVSLHAIQAQSDTISNSYEFLYMHTNPNLHYSYDFEKQIHNYSGNWDFDQDGIKDELYFVGKSGAHLFYSLRVILSSNHVIQNFPFLESDMPILPPDELINRPNFDLLEQIYPFVVVTSPDKKMLYIVITLDASSYTANLKILHKQKINTNVIALSFENHKPILRDYIHLIK
jgi:Tat protein secretion system quality control protein TatD with DNase activity